jgi:hypothetical protein
MVMVVLATLIMDTMAITPIIPTITEADFFRHTGESYYWEGSRFVASELGRGSVQ